MILWPKTLIPEVAERRCIIVLGAGASADCVSATGTNPPGWKKLLNDAAALLSDPAEKAVANSLISAERFLDAAEVIIASVNPPDFSQFLRDTFKTPAFEQSAIHEAVYELDTKIVLTTNYDEIYETFCRRGAGSSGYNTCRYYETHALNDVRSNTRVILKAHGCVTDPSKIVLSRTQYFKARQQYGQFFSILDALFLTNTLLFVGCGMNDPDVLLLLENVNIRASSHHPHYAVMESGQPPALVRARKENYNVQVLEYTAGRHGEVVDSLKELVTQVGNWRRTH